MLVNRCSTAEPIWTEGKIDSFENRRFSSVVVSDKNDVILEEKIG